MDTSFLICRTNVLLLDEPTNHLDMESIPNGYGVQYKVTTDIGLLIRWNYFKRLNEVVKSEKEKKFFKDYVENDREKYWKK